MASELTITRDEHDVHLYTVATFGIVRLARTPWGDVLIEASGLPLWTVSRGGRFFHRTWHAVEDGRGEVAMLNPKEKRIECGGRELTFTFHVGQQRRHRPTAVSEDGRVIATFAPRTWATKPLPFTVMDEEAARREPRLTLFAAWSAEYLHVSAGVAAMPG